MNFLPTPVLPKLSGAPSHPGAGEASVTNGKATDQATKASFSAVFTQANQQASTAKTPPNGKNQSESPALLSPANSETEIGVPQNSEGAEESFVALVTPIAPQPIPVEGVLLSSESNVASALTDKAPANPTAVPALPLLASPELLSEVEGSSGSVEKISSLPQIAPDVVAKTAIVGEKPSLALPNPSQVTVPYSGQNRPETFPGTPNDHQDPPLIASREQAVPLQTGNRGPSANIPLSFVNGGFSQGQVVIDPASTSQLAPAIQSQVQGPLTPVSSTSSVTSQDTLAHSEISGAGLGNGENAEDEFGSGGHEDNTGAFANRQQASKPIFGGFSMATELGSGFRMGESALSGRADAPGDRSRIMNVMSPHRLQMEVMLSDETKVQVDVAVTQHQVTAQLVTDQLMLRNLALQYEPQLDAQMASAGLELKQFGAEVSEHGLFGQHLSDSSSQEFSDREGGGTLELSNSDLLVGIGAEADGRVHFVA